MASMICEVFPNAVITLLIRLQEGGVAVSVGEHELALAPASRISGADHAELSRNFESFVLAAAFATDAEIRALTASYAAEPHIPSDIERCRCGTATSDAMCCWRCEIAVEIADLLTRQQQSVADCNAA